MDASRETCLAVITGKATKVLYTDIYSFVYPDAVILQPLGKLQLFKQKNWADTTSTNTPTCADNVIFGIIKKLDQCHRVPCVVKDHMQQWRTKMRPTKHF